MSYQEQANISKKRFLTSLSSLELEKVANFRNMSHISQLSLTLTHLSNYKLSIFCNIPVPPTEVNPEHQYKRYDNFPVPKLENVYQAWKPVDHGHPLRDETLYYAPPSMERVRFQYETRNSGNLGPQSRSIDDEAFHRSKDFVDIGPKITEPIVIPAEPKKEPKNHGYSVYGSPDINYSALYATKEKIKAPSGSAKAPQRRHDQLRFLHDGRENPLLTYTRNYKLNSALDSR